MRYAGMQKAQNNETTTNTVDAELHVTTTEDEENSNSTIDKEGEDTAEGQYEDESANGSDACPSSDSHVATYKAQTPSTSVAQPNWAESQPLLAKRLAVGTSFHLCCSACTDSGFRR
jgi:hypothetical protein